MSHNEADARARSKHADEMALINSAVQMVNSQLVNSSILQQQQGAGSHVGNSLGLGSGAGASGPTGFFDQYTMPPPPPPQVKNSNYANNNTFGGYGNSAAAAADRGYGGSNVYAPSTKLNPNAPHFNSGGPADPFVRAPGGQGPIRTSPTAQQGKFNNNFNSRHQYSSPMQQHQQPQQQQQQQQQAMLPGKNLGLLYSLVSHHLIQSMASPLTHRDILCLQANSSWLASLLHHWAGCSLQPE